MTIGMRHRFEHINDEIRALARDVIDRTLLYIEGAEPWTLSGSMIGAHQDAVDGLMSRARSLRDRFASAATSAPSAPPDDSYYLDEHGSRVEVELRLRPSNYDAGRHAENPDWRPFDPALYPQLEALWKRHREWLAQQKGAEASGGDSGRNQ